MTKLYAPITKSEEMDDGTIKVWGYASTDAVDSDGEIITSDAIKAALPDYMEWGAVREMHGSSAAGTAIEAFVQDDGKTFFGCHVIDPVAVTKVKKGVYKGFSIGGKVTKRNNLNKNLVEGIILVEVSLVDRPANPGAKFTMFKADNIDKTENLGDNSDMSDNNNNNKEETPVKELNKSFYDVARLSSILQELVWLQNCIESDNEWNDNQSSIPDELKNVISALGVVLVNQVTEETDNLKPEPEVLPVIEDAEKKEKNDLEKAGSRHSKSDKEKIQAIMDALVELGADLPEQKDTKDVSESAEKFAKFASDKKELEENLNKSLKTNEDLVKRIKEFEAMPRPIKGSLGAFSKSDDSHTTESKVVAPVIELGSSKEDETATAIKKAFLTPKRLF